MLTVKPGNVVVDIVPGHPEYQGCMYGATSMLGVLLHVMFIEVRDFDAPTAGNSDYQREIDAVCDFDNGYRYQLAEYEGRWFFVIAHPFQD